VAGPPLPWLRAAAAAVRPAGFSHALAQAGSSLFTLGYSGPTDAPLTVIDYLAARIAEQAWPDFRGWRVNYESVAYALAERLDAVPASWTGPRRTGDASVEPVRPPNRKPTPYQKP